jgi:hypothetical protein
MVCEAEGRFAIFEGNFPSASLSIPDFHCSCNGLSSHLSSIVGLIEAVCLELPPLRASREIAMTPAALLPFYCTRFVDGCLAIVHFFLVCATMRPMDFSIARFAMGIGSLPDLPDTCREFVT